MLTTQPNEELYLQRVSLFGCVVSICSMYVVKLMKLFSYFAGVFFYLQRIELSRPPYINDIYMKHLRIHNTTCVCYFKRATIHLCCFAFF